MRAALSERLDPIVAEKGKRMFVTSRLNLLLPAPLMCTPQVSARQYHSPTFPGDGTIDLAVVVTPKSGLPVSGLRQQDFTGRYPYRRRT